MAKAEGRSMRFELSPAQVAKYDEWRKSHPCRRRGKSGAIGGANTFSFTPTGIGDCVECSCVCGSKVDLTDSENW